MKWEDDFGHLDRGNIERDYSLYILKLEMKILELDSKLIEGSKRWVFEVLRRLLTRQYSLIHGECYSKLRELLHVRYENRIFEVTVNKW